MTTSCKLVAFDEQTRLKADEVDLTFLYPKDAAIGVSKGVVVRGELAVITVDRDRLSSSPEFATSSLAADETTLPSRVAIVDLRSEKIVQEIMLGDETTAYAIVELSDGS